MPSEQPITILGVDPGSQITGYGIIEIPHIQARNQFHLRDLGVFKAPRKLSYLERLLFMHTHLDEFIGRTKPNYGVFEKTYVSIHPQATIKLSETRGALIAATSRHPITLCEMTATEAKKAITGRGSTAKKDVALILKSMLKTHTMLQKPQKDDATDALALALAFALSMSFKNSVMSVTPLRKT
ncbi:MAG: crossover junction endodeoxyribonuclease RuvC [Proteobacteria bacterium]|nr:crossover junction endodeoxyribonuclease RuvC [Pseudomonadota bacterium]